MSPAAFASTAHNSASAIPAGAVTHGFTATSSSVHPDNKVFSVWAGYGQSEKSLHTLAAGADGWIIPKTTCNAANANPQYTFLLSWFDYSSADSTYAGIVAICAVGQSGPATLLILDSVNSYSGVSTGDQITAFVADYTSGCGSPCTVMYIVDWTTGGSVLDTLAQSSLADNQFAGIVDTASGCSTSTGICPQVHFSRIGDGSAYDTATSVVCAFNSDGTSPAYPCAGYGAPYSGSTYFYPIGVAPSGAIHTKFIMNTGDNGVIVAPFYTKTGALLTDMASHIYKFEQA